MSGHPQNHHIFCFAGVGTARGSDGRCRQLTLLFPGGLSCGMGSAHNHTFCSLVVAVILQGHLRNPLCRQRVGNINKMGCGHGGGGRQNWHPRGMPFAHSCICAQGRQQKHSERRKNTEDTVLKKMFQRVLLSIRVFVPNLKKTQP